MFKRGCVVLLVILAAAFAVPANSQDKSEKFAIFVTGLNDAAPVVQSLIKKLRDSKPFEPVTQETQAKSLWVFPVCPASKPTLQRARTQGTRLGRPRVLVPSERVKGVAGLSVDAAAHALGVSRSTLKRWRRQVQQSPSI